MTDHETRLLAVLPFGVARPLRWALHRAGLSHNHGALAARGLMDAGLLEAESDNKAGWASGAVLVRRMVAVEGVPTPPPLITLAEMLQTRAPTVECAGAKKIGVFGRKGRFFDSGRPFRQLISQAGEKS